VPLSSLRALRFQRDDEGCVQGSTLYHELLPRLGMRFGRLEGSLTGNPTRLKTSMLVLLAGTVVLTDTCLAQSLHSLARNENNFDLARVLRHAAAFGGGTARHRGAGRVAP
jgi:hypothetical protein